MTFKFFHIILIHLFQYDRPIIAMRHEILQEKSCEVRNSEGVSCSFLIYERIDKKT
jgi:hypothetical protein